VAIQFDFYAQDSRDVEHGSRFFIEKATHWVANCSKYFDQNIDLYKKFWYNQNINSKTKFC